MEIASVALFEPAASGAESAQDQAPRTGFEQCLGAAMQQEPEASGEHAASTPPPQQTSSPETPGPLASGAEDSAPGEAANAQEGPVEALANELLVCQECGTNGVVPALKLLLPQDPGVAEGPGATASSDAAAMPVDGLGQSSLAEAVQTAALGASGAASGSPAQQLAAAARERRGQEGTGQRAEPVGDETVAAEQVRNRAANVFKTGAGSERLWNFMLRSRAGVAAAGVRGEAATVSAAGGEGEAAAESRLGTAAPGAPVAAADLPAGTVDGDTVPLPGRGGEPGLVSGAAPVGGDDKALASATGMKESSADTPPPRQVPASTQVAQAARVLLARGGDRVSVQLEPESLGKVQVVLTRGEGGVTAQFRVEQPLTQQALQADAPLLRQALEARGVNVAHVSVEMQQGEEQAGKGGQQPQRSRRSGNGLSEEEGEMAVDEMALGQPAWRPWGFEARI